MNPKSLLVIGIVAVIATIVLIPTLSSDIADARSTKKIHFTETFVSTQNPGQDQTDQFALVLGPEQGIIYDGSITFTSDEPVQIVILHEIEPDESLGQPIWTVDGKTIYGQSTIETVSRSASYEFTGAALGLLGEKPFVATVSVDGWVRGGALEFITKTIEIQKNEPSIHLYESTVPAILPLHSGIYNGNQTRYIITDASEESLAKEISDIQNWNVELAPSLSNAPESVLGEIYFFTNGVNGDGLYGFQDEIFSSVPTLDEYTALRKVNNVSWRLGQNYEILHSIDDIQEAEKNNQIKIERTDSILNASQIIWPDGQMPIRPDAAINFVGGQITDIDTKNDTVTFVAHRGWGPDGQTIYYIVTDATPTAPAKIMGLVDAPTNAQLLPTPAATDQYHFKNGLVGEGLVGFQPAISAAVPGDDLYSPMWRIFLVEWNNPDDVSLLETVRDVGSARTDGLVTVGLARPTNSDHIVNAPIINPFQNLKG